MSDQVLEKVYKVVRDGGGDHFYSAVVMGGSKYCMPYSTDWFTYPIEGSKLLCFDTYEHALRFFRSFVPYGTVIWEAAAINPEPIDRLIDDYWLYERFWSGERRGNYKAPLGTLACAALKLVRVVSSQEEVR